MSRGSHNFKQGDVTKVISAGTDSGPAFRESSCVASAEQQSRWNPDSPKSRTPHSSRGG
jgi:hypothetical protein